ncbi:MAG: class II aldolase/adducin family protein [Chloroflexi bacterium]|nr:class II aldolase/adducin family protein [Chloroflexota bacterium]MCI0779601.1 class II aldolase/adducin family protein [Chloroflexota bacterium]MCI0816037.1 class II aldolase/adducin family protein [Chloroflexota bacterium]
MGREIDEVKYEVAIATRILAATGLATGVTAGLGHVSMRVPNEPDKFVVKGRGYEIDSLAEMQYDDMILCDMEGYKIDGPARSTQCSEVKIHACILRERPDVMSVVHVHPRNVILMTVLEETLVPMCQEGADLVRTPLPLYPHTRTVWSEEEGMELVEVLGDAKAVLMQGHGATMTGRSTSDAVISMLQLEEQARMNRWAVAAAGSDHKRISDAFLDEATNRPRQDEYPHFKELMIRIGGNPPRNGTWNSYRKQVSADMVKP